MSARPPPFAAGMADTSVEQPLPAYTPAGTGEGSAGNVHWAKHTDRHPAWQRFAGSGL